MLNQWVYKRGLERKDTQKSVNTVVKGKIDLYILDVYIDILNDRDPVFLK